MAFTPVPTYVPNTPMQVAAALRYVDANGNLVSQLYPTDYLSLVGSTTGTQVNQIAQINQILATYQTTLTSLQNQINAINTSGVTAIPQVNAFCLSSPINQVLPINVVTTYLVANACSYNSALGTPSALSTAVLTENPSVLNPLPAYSQNSAMAGLSGWIPVPVTIADAVNNLWLDANDKRAGINKVIAAVTPTCAQVIINAQVTLPAFGTGFNIYFDGYTYVPTGYTDGGSTIKIVDSNGNVAINGINIITQSTTNSPYNFATSGTTLSQQATYYTVYINSNVTNTGLGLTCVKTIVMPPTYPVTPIQTNCCPDIGTCTLVVTSGVTVASSYVLISGLSYTPRYVGITSKTAANYGLSTMGFSDLEQIYITYVAGGARINFASGGWLANFNGTMKFDWIAYQ